MENVHTLKYYLILKQLEIYVKHIGTLHTKLVQNLPLLRRLFLINYNIRIQEETV